MTLHVTTRKFSLALTKQITTTMIILDSHLDATTHLIRIEPWTPDAAL